MEVFPLGKISLKLLHTPGHTLESMCLLLIDEEGKEQAVFTGDTVFVGDVGRPDLAVKSTLSKEDLAGLLFDSIQKKIMPLADEVIIYPGHGAGSACGKNIGKETQTTIGEQKKNNYALCCATREDFIKQVTDGLEEPPKYFFMDAGINKNGYENIEDIMLRNAIGLEPNAFDEESKKGAIILDARNADEFEKGFVPGSINIGLNGQYAVWVGALLDHTTPIIVVADEGKENESILRLARVGYEHVYGYLKGGFEAWLLHGKPIELVESIEAQEMLGIDKHTIIDVRNPNEWSAGVLEGAELIPLSKLEEQIKHLDKQQKYLIHCAGGYRSMMAASIMKKHEFEHVKNVRGGINKIKESGFMLVIPA
jgi:rhodanese-related sulfurtransferase